MGKFGKKFLGKFLKLHIANITNKALWGTLAVLTFCAVVFPTNISATAQDDLNNVNAQINAVNKQLAQKQNEKASLENEIAMIDLQIEQINLQIDATQREINILTTQINDTNVQISKAEAELKVHQDQMSVYLREMYEDGQVSLVEQIAKSNTLSEFMNQHEYLSTIQAKIKETADKITALKSQLEARKKQLEEARVKTESLKAGQVAQQQAVAAQRAYKDSLRAQVAAQQAGLQGQLSNLHAKMAALSAQFGESIIGGGSSYPYGNPPPRGRIDTPDAYGYLIGECTSYAAWKRASMGRPVPRGMGNAKTWASAAAAKGLAVDRTPRAGDVIVMPYVGYYGHVGIVDAVYGNGTILISEYNWTPFSYSKRTINPYNYGALFIH